MLDIIKGYHSKKLLIEAHIVTKRQTDKMIRYEIPLCWLEDA